MSLLGLQNSSALCTDRNSKHVFFPCAFHPAVSWYLFLCCEEENSVVVYSFWGVDMDINDIFNAQTDMNPVVKCQTVSRTETTV